MSAKVAFASQTQFPNATQDVVKRRSANYSPSIWGDYFLSYASMEANTKMEQHAQELKEKLKSVIMAPDKKLLQKLDLIDDIQQLGVSHHFEYEIEEVLQQIHKNSHDCGDGESDDDLYTTALRFRLLRQQGYNVSSDIFNKFKDGDGKFKELFGKDVVGLVSLYEAAHLRIHGEDILDQALNFTTTHLESASHQLSPPLSKQVTHALHQPFRKGYPRLEARRYLSIYQEDDSHDETLLTFAKLDFNLLQKTHQKEISEITRWWKDLDFVNKLPFARDRVVESYFWALGCYFEPEFYFARMTLSKVTAMLAVTDDIYDVHGTFEELELFTQAVERWDISAMEELPEYMKIFYQALIDVYSEIEQNLANQGNVYRIHYAREAMKFQVKAYLKEAKWFHNKYTPTVDEYLSVALDTSCIMLLATTSLIGMGDIVTKDSLDWVFSDPKILKASSLIGRLMDDMKSHQFEQKRGHIASAVECYMKEYGATEEEATMELRKHVNDAWKDINEGCLHPITVPMALLLRILNNARVSEVVYKNDDGFTHPEVFLKDYVISLFVEPVPL